MTHHFIHLTHPGSAIAAARRLGLSSLAISRAGRAKPDKAFEKEADPELESILDEMEAQRTDEDDFDAFLDRIGSGADGQPMAGEEDAATGEDELDMDEADLDEAETPDTDDDSDDAGDIAADLVENDLDERAGPE